MYDCPALRFVEEGWLFLSSRSFNSSSTLRPPRSPRSTTTTRCYDRNSAKGGGVVALDTYRNNL